MANCKPPPNINAGAACGKSIGKLCEAKAGNVVNPTYTYDSLSNLLTRNDTSTGVGTAGVGTIAAPALPTGTNPYSSAYLHHDQLGSIVAMTNTSGAVVERLAYDPWRCSG